MMKTEKSKDLISRADAIEAVFAVSRRVPTMAIRAKDALESLPSAEAVQGYTEWLEKIIVEVETFEWICEDTPCPEWCNENCSYASIQAECLRHLYEVSKGGGSE